MKSWRNKRRFWAIVAVAAVLLALFFQALLPVLAASPPNIISYQGRVLNSAGVPLTDSSASVIFQIYDASSGGNCLWSNSSASCATATAMTVTLTDGLFSVNLGDTNASFAAIGDSIFADNTSTYLGVTINSETLTPRRQIVAAPYAHTADTLDGFNSSQSGGTSAFAPITNSSGNLTLTGNPQSTAISGGSLYINPSSADADEALFGVALNGSSRLLLDEDGDGTFAGTVTANDFACSDCLDFTELGDSLTLDAAVSITGLAGRSLNIYRTLTDATAENALGLFVTALDTTSATGSQYGLVIENSASTEALDALFVLSNNDSDDTVGTGLYFAAGGSGTDFTYGIDFDAATIDTADIRFENSGTLAEASAGNWTFDRSSAGIVTIQATDDDSNTDFSIIAGGTGQLLLDPSGAGSIVLGSSDVTSVTFTTDNNSDSDFSFTGGITFNDDVVISAGAGEVFEITRTLTDAAAENGVSLSVTASDTTSGPNSQYALLLDNAASTEAVDGLLAIQNSDGDDPVPAGIVFLVGGSGVDFTFGLDFDFANLGTADIRFENSGTLAEASGGVWTFNHPTDTDIRLQATDSVNANTSFIIGSAGTGSITLDADAGAGASINFDAYDATNNTTGTVSVSVGSGGFNINSFATTTDAVAIAADAVTSADGLQMTVNGLTTGTGIRLERNDNATDFDGTALLYVNQLNNNLTSDGEAMRIDNWAGGTSVGLFITQNGVDDAGANGTGQTALIIDVNEAAADNAADEDVFIIRSDADGTPDTEFIVQLDGDIQYDGTASSPASDIAEVYPSSETLTSGDVIAFDSTRSGAVRKTQTTYESGLFGAVSTKPAVRMGSEVIGYDVALLGRIPVKVSAENGAIAVGDPLTSASIPGYAMKATRSGPIVGYALEPLTGGEGAIIVYVESGWWGGGTTSALPGTDNTASQLTSLSAVQSLDILRVGLIESIQGNWQIAEDGTFRTKGLITNVVTTASGEEVDLFATTSPQVTAMLSGTVTLINGTATVLFEEVAPAFNDVLSEAEPIRVFITAAGPTGTLYVSHKEKNGFTIAETGGSSTSIPVDWLVIGTRLDSTAPTTSTLTAAPFVSVSPSEDITDSEVMNSTEALAGEVEIPDAESIEEEIISEEIISESGENQTIEPVSTEETEEETNGIFVVDTTIAPTPLTLVEETPSGEVE